jgi:hypothetical protein
MSYVLHVYRAPSGQLSGRLFSGDKELCAVAGCATVEEVVEAIEDTGQEVDMVVDALTGQVL